MDNRLKRQRDFDAVFNKGKKVFSDNLTLIYLKRQFGETKIGISVGKKHGKAVVRNRIKRLIRAVYIPLLPYVKESYFIVFLPRVRESYSYESFKKSVVYLLKREHLLDECFQ